MYCTSEHLGQSDLTLTMQNICIIHMFLLPYSDTNQNPNHNRNPNSTSDCLVESVEYLSLNSDCFIYIVIMTIDSIRKEKIYNSVILLFQCSTNNLFAVSSSLRGFHHSVALGMNADRPQQDQVLTLCTQENGIRTVTLNYAEKR